MSLHTGWAIETAIGSEHKIDATYISNDIDIAMNLNRSLENYGISLIFVLANYLMNPGLHNNYRLLVDLVFWHFIV